MVVRECPQCAETMHRIDREVKDWVPGTPQQAITKVSEWVCPECDHFEEATDRDDEE